MSWHLKFLSQEQKQTVENLARGMAAASFYADLDPDGRRLSPSDAEKTRGQLMALTICLRDARHLNRLRQRELHSTISLMRMIQRALALALSDDPDHRRRAASTKELAPFAVTAVKFWRDL